MRFDNVTDRRAVGVWECGCAMVDYHSDVCSAKNGESALGDNDESDNDTVSTGDGEDIATKSNYLNHLCAESACGPVTGFENISVVNSNDVLFGNKTFYNGPVTIKQFIYSNVDDVRSTVDTDSCTADKRNVERLFKKLNSSLASPEPILHNVCGTYPLEAKDDYGVEKSNSVNNEATKPNGRQESSVKSFFSFCGLHPKYLLVGAASLVVCLLLITLTVLIVKQGNSELASTSSGLTDDHSTDDNFTNYTSGNVRFMIRKQWLAQPSEGKLDKLTLPVPYVIISHTATENCSTNAECVLHVRTIQTFHIESRGWSDIGYNFLVGGDGFVYVGRDWGYVGAHTYGYNNKSIGISFIGTFTNVVPPLAQQTAAKKLIELGVTMGKISPAYKLLAHRQLSATESPGTAFFKELREWPHWAPTP